jgi:hypothetical protein
VLVFTLASLELGNDDDDDAPLLLVSLWLLLLLFFPLAGTNFLTRSITNTFWESLEAASASADVGLVSCIVICVDDEDDDGGNDDNMSSICSIFSCRSRHGKNGKVVVLLLASAAVASSVTVAVALLEASKAYKHIKVSTDS